MKKLAVIALTILFIHTLSAQDITARTYIEKTVVASKLGTAIGYIFPCNVEVGGFYQKNAEFMNGHEITKRFYEKEFVGMYLNLPLKHYRKINFDLNIRTGAVNGKNFAITPSLLGSYRPVKAIKMGVGLGTRMFRPTLQAALSIRLSKLH